MGTSNRRERELARQHHLRQQQRRAEARLRKRRRNQTIAAVLSVVAVIAATFLVFRLVGDDGTTTAAPVDPDTEAGASATPTPTKPGICPEPKGKAAEPKPIKSEPKLTIDRKADYVATLATNCGEIGIDLFEDKAAHTVNSFAFLAKRGYFDKSPCHRLTGANEGIFVLQCGDPTGTGRGGPGYGFGIENAPKTGRYPSGTVAMARGSDPKSNGSQFFIVYRDTELPANGGGYSIFGRVTKGLDVVSKVASAGIDPSAPPAPLQRISVESVTVEKKA
ncbi:MAG: peptidylprolyl isomerase [Actinomycetota bacterium]|nr:peptidylprolyl isomerase [Actinomycetota bacterium]